MARSRCIRIVYVIDDLGLGGAQRQLVALVKALPRERYAAHVVSLSAKKLAYESAIREAGIPLTLIPHEGTWSWSTLLSLRRTLRSSRPTIVHTWLFTADLYGRLAAFLVRTPQVICAIRNTIDDMPWHHRLVNRLLALGTACMTVNADAIRPGFIRQGGIPERKLRTIHNGFDFSATPEVSPNGRYQQEWGLPPKARVVAMVARFAPQKDHRTLLDAARRVAGEMPDAYFVLVGEGPLRDEMQQKAAEMGLSARVRFLGARRDVWDILCHVDVCAHATHFEGCSNAIMEAMAAGRPVVATNVGGNAELIVDGQTGWLVPHEDAGALAHAILRVLRDPTSARAMGERGRARIAEAFSFSHTIAKTQALYEELLSRRRAT